VCIAIIISIKIESMVIDMKKVCCSEASFDEELKLTADFLKVIAEPNRLKILCILTKEGEKCVCDIWTYLNAPQNLTSHHLKVLKDSNLIQSRKDGLNVFYSVNTSGLAKSRQLFEAVLTCNKQNC
jgi:ArsR family transcriptional regulator, arsenate/arsenite/antimonite-responsive transcriptional repressor